ncbi:MAG: oxalate/formate MFS antiporter, partial [Acidobacteria bacterium]
TNYGFLYMAQGVGSVLGGPVAALVHDAFKSWMPVFATIITMNFATALLAGAALKPMRRRWLTNRSLSGAVAAPLIPAGS